MQTTICINHTVERVCQSSRGEAVGGVAVGGVVVGGVAKGCVQVIRSIRVGQLNSLAYMANYQRVRNDQR